MLSLIFIALDQESRISHEILTAAVSSTISFLVISVLTSATGVACGYYFMRRQRRKQSSSLITNQPMEPLYEDVNPLPSVVEHQENGLELTENVAYGTAKPTDPLHHEALPNAVEHQEQGLELKENVAYGTAKPTEHLHHEALSLPSAVEHQEQGLELKENVAYGTTKSMTH